MYAKRSCSNNLHRGKKYIYELACLVWQNERGEDLRAEAKSCFESRKRKTFLALNEWTLLLSAELAIPSTVKRRVSFNSEQFLLFLSSVKCINMTVRYSSPYSFVIPKMNLLIIYRRVILLCGGLFDFCSVYELLASLFFFNIIIFLLVAKREFVDGRIVRLLDKERKAERRERGGKKRKRRVRTSRWPPKAILIKVIDSI